MKGPIRNEYRDAWRNGDFEEIPPHVLTLLEKDYSHEKGSTKKEREQKASAQKTSKEVKE